MESAKVPKLGWGIFHIVGYMVVSWRGEREITYTITNCYSITYKLIVVHVGYVGYSLVKTVEPQYK